MQNNDTQNAKYMNKYTQDLESRRYSDNGHREYRWASQEDLSKFQINNHLKNNYLKNLNLSINPALPRKIIE